MRNYTVTCWCLSRVFWLGKTSGGLGLRSESCQPLVQLDGLEVIDQHELATNQEAYDRQKQATALVFHTNETGQAVEPKKFSRQQAGPRNQRKRSSRAFNVKSVVIDPGSTLLNFGFKAKFVAAMEKYLIRHRVTLSHTLGLMTVANQVEEGAMHARVVGKFGMKGGSHDSSLPDGDGIAALGGYYFYVRS